MHIKNTSKKLNLALMALTLLSACKQPVSSYTLERHGRRKVIAGGVLGATGVAAIGTYGTLMAVVSGEALWGVIAASVFLLPFAIVTIPIGIGLLTQGITERKKAKKLAKLEREAALAATNTSTTEIIELQTINIQEPL